MKKYRLAYYRWRRKRLREAMRKMNRLGTKPTPKSSARYTKLRKKYEELGMKWWDLRTPAMFAGAPFGKDITHEDYTMNDVREAMSGQNPFQAKEGTWEYRSIRVLEDKSSKVEFKNVDGELHMFRDGEKVSDYPVKGLGSKD